MRRESGTGTREHPGIAELAETLAAHDDRLSNCVHCGFCLPACPTYVRLGDEADSPRGRLHLMRAVAEERLDPAAEGFQRHLDRCLGCRACETACPSGVEYGFLLERAREVAGRAARPGLAGRILLALVDRPILFRLWMGGSRALRWSRIAELLGRALPSRGPLRTARLGMEMLAASGAASSVHGKVQVERTAGSDPSPDRPATSRGRVALLTGCVQDQLFRRVNRATADVLGVNGWEVVEVGDQGCCGALHAHAGRLDEARRKTVRNARAFRAAGVDRIAVNAAGCGATMRESLHLLREDEEAEVADEVRWFAERVRDVSELLADGDGLRTGAPLPLRAAYDPPCHLLHGQRVGIAPETLLGSIPGLEVVPVPNGEECCGGAGIYGITHPDLGGRIGLDKADAVVSTGADVLVTGNPGCAMQIGAFLRRREANISVAHPVELLDESYRRGGLYGSEPASPRPDEREER